MSEKFSADPYTDCPVFESSCFLFRLVNPADAEDLLAVYADPAAQEILNECSAWNCDFGYGAKDLEAMGDCIGRWIEAYNYRIFVRFSIIDKQSGKVVGTAEFYHSKKGGFFDEKIFLRLDLRSDYENEKAIDEMLSLIVKEGIKPFGADGIITRAMPVAAGRVNALIKNGFVLSDKTLRDSHGWEITYGDFWVRDAE